MDKQQIITFLEEQREARLIGNNPNSQSDFDKWQLKQAKTFQEIIDWIKRGANQMSKYTFLVTEYSSKESVIPSNNFLLTVKSCDYEEAIKKTKNSLPQDKRKFTLELREIEVE